MHTHYSNPLELGYSCSDNPKLMLNSNPLKMAFSHPAGPGCQGMTTTMVKVRPAYEPRMFYFFAVWCCWNATWLPGIFSDVI